tara:strand:- start:433 stop:1980 length:1548 start_codon:yes stop_codon:yes gene_type:complete
MAYKFQLGTSVLSGSITPTNDDSFDLGASGKEFKDLYIDGTANVDAINLNGTAISATAAEINYLDNDDLVSADIQKLADLTATAAELNKLDGAGAAVTAAKLTTLSALSDAEIGFLDGATTAGVASKAVIMDANKDVGGVRNLSITGDLTVQGTTTTIDSTTINVSSSFTFEGPADDFETTLGIIDPTADRTINLPNQSGTIPLLAAVSATQISSTPEELNLVDGSSAGTIVNSKAVIYGSSGEVNATTLQIAGSSITATAAEINLLDGITRGSILVGGSGGSAELDAKTSGQVLVGDGTDLASVAISGDITLAANGDVTIANDAVESGMLNDNVISGQTDIGAAIVAGDEILISDGGTLRKTAVSRLKTYIQSGVNVYKLSGSGTIDGIIGAASGSGFYYNDAAGSEEDGLPFESVYMISGSSWTTGAEVKIKAPQLASGGKISIYAQSSSAGDFIHSIDGIQSETSGSNMAELGEENDDIPAIVLESDNAAVTLVLYDAVVDGGTTNYQWAIM